MERSDWLQRCLVRKLGAASDFLGANIRFHSLLPSTSFSLLPIPVEHNMDSPRPQTMANCLRNGLNWSHRLHWQWPLPMKMLAGNIVTPFFFATSRQDPPLFIPGGSATVKSERDHTSGPSERSR